mmetsp:Transcript_7501/g.13060  ORF Transcript_7501/g.13060 Transcript_7501/m.13060 type:complete len:290 (-) Transcript_7501:1755-2624(-)
MISRWRPTVRRLYKRVHPDFLGQFPSARLENEASIKELEGAMASRPTNTVELKFNVLSDNRTRVERVAKAVIKPVSSDSVWRNHIDAVLRQLEDNILGPPSAGDARDGVRRSRKERSPPGFEWLGPLNEDASFGYDEDNEDDEGDEDFEIKEPEPTAVRSQILFTEKDWQEINRSMGGCEPIFIPETVTDVAKHLFRSGQMRCSDKTDPFESIELMMLALEKLGLERSARLLTPLFSDVVVVFDSECETSLSGCVLTVDTSCTADELAKHLLSTVHKMEDFLHGEAFTT